MKIKTGFQAIWAGNMLKIDKHKNTSHLFNLFTSSGFIPTITRPTRITHTSCTLIDNIYTNITTSDATIHSGILTYDISDHLPILTSIGHDKTCKAQPLKIQYRPIDDKA